MQHATAHTHARTHTHTHHTHAHTNTHGHAHTHTDTVPDHAPRSMDDTCPSSDTVSDTHVPVHGELRRRHVPTGADEGLLVAYRPLGAEGPPISPH